MVNRCLLALVTNYVELKLDSYTICCQSRRVIPQLQEDIGQWIQLIRLLTVVGVTTNSLYICFVDGYCDGWKTENRFLLFVVINYVAGIIIVMVPAFSSMDTEIQQARQDFIIPFLFNDTLPNDNGDVEDDVERKSSDRLENDFVFNKEEEWETFVETPAVLCCA